VTGDDVRSIDFGKVADDYAQHRPGFPRQFFDHVHEAGVGLPGQRVLDVGTGTGTLARGFARRGCIAVGLDPSAAMLAEAARLAACEGLTIQWVTASAEETGLPEAHFDIVCAGQCWHWFDRSRAAAEAMRVLRSGGRALIAYFNYLSIPGTVGAATEEIVLRYNPTWTFAGQDGPHPQFASDLTAAGFLRERTFDFVLPVTFTHEDWRGRFRACNGVLTLPREAVAAFDADLDRMLRDHYPDPLVSDHRICGVLAEKPAR
jgi:ubiquinone/menaquinone biosynthesis C-methylase UbiE